MRLANSDYTIGWISALADELTSARAVLDDEHESLPTIRGDHNAYILGHIGSHNVAIAGLPEGTLGSSAAGHAAANLFRSFSNVRFALMVGVGGGVPLADIRLGDVVVSIPERQAGGVIQYDMGTNQQDDQFIRKGFLKSPPLAILTAIKKLRSKARMQGYKMSSYHEQVLEKYPRLRPEFERPSRDNLYQAEYIHSGMKGDCFDCDSTKLIVRPCRDESFVHYGLIGSGNQILRNAEKRDKLYQQEGIICFEMEAAGLMQSLDCLAIRGISDYCDTHKSKVWQPYAGAMAAAFAKELLLELPIQEAEHQNPILDIVDQNMKQVFSHNEETRALQIAREREEELQKAIAWLEASNPESNYQLALRLREPNTGKWLIDSDIYKEWKLGSSRHLWIHGKAGCGKSVILATIVEDLRRQCKDLPNTGCGMFYFTFSDTKKQSYRDCLRSLVFQLSAREPASSELAELFRRSNDGVQRDIEESLQKILVSTIETYDQFFLALDGLDESPDTIDANHKTRHALLRWLQTLVRTAPIVKILATSRFLHDIRDTMDNLQALQISMATELVNDDVESYVNSHLSGDLGLSRIELSMKQEIRRTLVEKSDGMFRWVYCQIIALKKLQVKSSANIRRLLKDLPYTLDETYERVLRSLDEYSLTYIHALLKWLAYSTRPLNKQELATAITIDIDSIDGACVCSDSIDLEDIVDTLSGLILIVDDNTSGSRRENQSIIRLAHFSVKEYLESRRILDTGLKDFHLEEDLCHQFLSDCCVAYLLHYSAIKRQANAIHGRTNLTLMSYATHEWMKHCRKSNNVELPVRLLSNPETVGCFCSIDKSPACGLYHAARFGLSKVVDGLLQVGMVVSPKHGCGDPLSVAARKGYTDIVQRLIQAGAELESVNCDMLPLQLASLNGHQDISRCLLDAGADTNARKEWNEPGSWFKARGDHTPLSLAIGSGHLGIVKMLIQAGANVNIVHRRSDEFHSNALAVAALYSSEETVRILLDSGASLESDLWYCDNALLNAASRGHAGICKLLIGAGANTNHKCHAGTPLIAAARDGHQKIVRVLIEAGADADAICPPYGTALLQAANHHRKDLFQLLLELGADIHVYLKSHHDQIDSVLFGSTCHRLWVLDVLHQYGVSDKIIDSLRFDDPPDYIGEEDMQMSPHSQYLEEMSMEDHEPF